jgi:phosphoglycolate phosphatase
MAYSHIFFDLDGTLTDSAPGITNAIIYARKKWGLPVGTNADYYRFIGPPMPESYEQFWGFSHEDAVRFLADYREYFSQKGLFENRVYSGIPELLQALKDAGRHLYIATTKPTEFSQRIAEKFDFAKYFDIISGAGLTKDNTKYDVIRNARDACAVDMTDAVMVGDKLHDVEGAHLHHIPCIGVSYGFGGREELAAAGADIIVDTVEQLRSVLLADSAQQ